MLRKHAVSLALLLPAREAAAARLDGQTICDYYAAERFGASNATTQLRLMQSIVSLAYAGVDSQNTGIFNWGTAGESIGRADRDGRKQKPGSTLFSHWYFAFGKIYSCSEYKSFAEAFDPLNPAYVHKYMDLNQTHIGYFIEQLISASQSFGFSDTDATTLSNYMNSKYNLRCIPPDHDQLTSICLARDCPLAAPAPKCDAYNDIPIRGVGVGSSGGSSGGSSNNGSTTTTAAAATSSTGSSAPSPSSTAAAGGGHSSSSSSSSSGLSAGAIAGIAIGAAAVVLLALALGLFFRRQTKPRAGVDPGGAQTVGDYPASLPQSPPPHSINTLSGYYDQSANHSYVSPRLGSPPPPKWPEHSSPVQELGTVGHETASATTPVMTNGGFGFASAVATSPVQQHPPAPAPAPDVLVGGIAEMESPEPPSGWDHYANRA
ncbi:hypothetical protein UVI_02021260 [Ustilaginoidea virens]|uniref:Uncharacterized protein n=1 Tax=Ustilaginoidea virens TaxID=1159556 RepID=A0A1B5L0C9_USTVR|nr:hypothetical protein UVI_02021260 [Ustilaginoidea virens]